MITSGNTQKTDGVIYYKVQFLTSPSVLPAGSPKLKGIKDAEYYMDGGVLKYTSGTFSSQEEAAAHLRNIKKKFSDAFIIRMRDGQRIK